MKKFILFLFLVFNLYSQAQNTLLVNVKDEDSKENLIGANCIIEGSNLGASSDNQGIIKLNDIPNGKQVLIFSYVGYKTLEKTFSFPMKEKEVQLVYLEPDLMLNEVAVYSTRTENRIEEIPTRIEVLGNEEVVEETAINPGNISKLLGETSGIQVQHNSAISGNVSFRIQGLPGQYTQLLQDGLPLYGGFSSGLSLLQIPPLDLQQVEIIKGSSSTLYGSDAIAGIVNLITKKPTDKPSLSVLFNQTHKGGRDISSYYSGKSGKFGISLLAGLNTQKAEDVSGNNYTDIPYYNRAVVSPKLFYEFNDDNHLMIGLSSTVEDRIGGDIQAVEGEKDLAHPFFEENKSTRLNAQIKYEYENDEGNIFTIKASYGNFNRKLKTNTNLFSGIQNTIYTELSYYIHSEKHQWVNGLNYNYDAFRQAQSIQNKLDYTHQSVGLFSQDNWKLNDDLFLEPGIRIDFNQNYGGYFLPRLAMMYHLSNQFFTRLSAGLGYKLPTPFMDEAERIRYQKVTMPSNLEIEKSSGINLDFNFKTPLFEDLFLNLSQSFFITQIHNPIIANPDSLQQNQSVYYENAAGNILSKGLNTNIRLSYEELVLYLDYTYLQAKKTYDHNYQLELTPKNKLTATLAYEDEEEGWKAGLEAFYFGRQQLEQGSQSPDYWLLGASAQKTIGHICLALNVENILDIRQTRYENIVSGPINNPRFSELYAPLDGFVGNIVLKFDF
jgi:iron complex outermembrane receptor protein